MVRFSMMRVGRTKNSAISAAHYMTAHNKVRSTNIPAKRFKRNISFDQRIVLIINACVYVSEAAWKSTANKANYSLL